MPSCVGKDGASRRLAPFLQDRNGAGSNGQICAPPQCPAVHLLALLHHQPLDMRILDGGSLPYAGLEHGLRLSLTVLRRFALHHLPVAPRGWGFLQCGVTHPLPLIASHILHPHDAAHGLEPLGLHEVPVHVVVRVVRDPFSGLGVFPNGMTKPCWIPHNSLSESNWCG